MKYVLFVIVALILAELALFVLWSVLVMVSSYLIKPIEYTKFSTYYHFLLTHSIASLLGFMRVHVHVSGKEKLPEGRFLLAANHKSNFDPMISWVVFRDRPLAFISKEGNFHIPWFGRIIRKLCCLAIDRDDPRKALETVDKAAALVRSGEVSMGVYPEGTRNYNEGLLPFHNCVFKIAQKANVPIVVVKTTGTEHIHENFLKRRTDVTFDIVEVISASDVASHKRTDELGERVRTDLLQQDIAC